MSTLGEKAFLAKEEHLPRHPVKNQKTSSDWVVLGMFNKETI
jgi:hypothetical protein